MAITINHQTNDISATSGSISIDGSTVASLTGITDSGSPNNTALGTGAADALTTGDNTVALGFKRINQRNNKPKERCGWAVYTWQCDYRYRCQRWSRVSSR